MTISYNWLCTYLPVNTQIEAQYVDPEKISKTLTALGLEVESMTHYQSVPGGLEGLIVGEVLSTNKHTNADKLTVTQVNIGLGTNLQIVCGAPNVAVGQKVAVAPVGTTIFPVKGEPILMKKAKIRGIESEGMICAEDEIGLGENHDGILVLDPTAKPGTLVKTMFEVHEDWIYEIGLTPNRMDAMSHLGVARDVCAWLGHHHNRTISVVNPLKNVPRQTDAKVLPPISVTLHNEQACRRYAGAFLSGVTVQKSPTWLQNRLKAIGIRPINNVVDITNFILHETGQPLHAFDATKIKGQKIWVGNLASNTPFKTLDGKERALHEDDLMICDGEQNPLCIGGVFGGLDSGVTAETTQIFLESAWFDPTSIRKTSFRHGLRTDAATRFEKGVDISKTTMVLQRAVHLLLEIAGGEWLGGLIDVYPKPQARKELALKYHYLKKLSGKNYHPDAIKQILVSLDFEFLKEGNDDLWFSVPHSKPDISLPADLVEEIMRIDGYDQIEIPNVIAMSPSQNGQGPAEQAHEKAANYLVGLGYREILTNSITNSAYYNEEELKQAIKMINNLSAELNVMRTSMLHAGLEVIARNLNRRNNQLALFEFGKTYHSFEVNKYVEEKKLAIFQTGALAPSGWQQKPQTVDLFYLKGTVEALIKQLGIRQIGYEEANLSDINGLLITSGSKKIGKLGMVHDTVLKKMDIKQPVVAAILDWDQCLQQVLANNITYQELNRFPFVERDLALVVNQDLAYAEVQNSIVGLGMKRMKSIDLFDVFESEKLGAGKKSLAIHLVFEDHEKTLTDEEVDNMMRKITKTLEQQLQATLRN